MRKVLPTYYTYICSKHEQFTQEVSGMIEYRIIREIQKNPNHTQRSLASELGVSLGKANYLLAGLIQKGIVKAKKIKNAPEKIRWRYMLTPQGLREKAAITKNYLAIRLEEFDRLQNEINELKKEIV